MGLHGERTLIEMARREVDKGIIERKLLGLYQMKTPMSDPNCPPHI